MKISVVTISYNQAKFLRECIDSVLNQDYQDLEYIVVDAGSVDESRKIIDSYGDRIIKCYEKDNGPADALNKGFSLATGDIYYFINSDDYVLPNTFSEIISIFKSNHEIDVVLSGGYHINEFGIKKGFFYPSKVSAKLLVNGAVTFFQQGMFFKADIFNMVGGFNNLNIITWDSELLLNFILHNAKFHRIMRMTAAFRIYNLSITGSKRLAKEFNLSRIRCFKIVYGENRQPNVALKFYYRVIKFFNDPYYLFVRLLSVFKK